MGGFEKNRGNEIFNDYFDKQHQLGLGKQVNTNPA